MEIIHDKYWFPQKLRSQVHKYGSSLYVSGFEIKDNVVYYRINHMTDYNNRSFISNVYITRYSELHALNLNIKDFPSRTLFRRTDEEFIRRRIEALDKWLLTVLINGNVNILLSSIKLNV